MSSSFSRPIKNKVPVVLTTPPKKENPFFRQLIKIDFTIKVNVKKQLRFDRSKVIFKLKSKMFECA